MQDIFDEVFPMYLSFGMTPEQYWHGEPSLTQAYYRAHMLKTERMNQEAWLSGFYVCQAVSVALSNAFAKKGTKPIQYPEAHRITPLTKEERQEEERKKKQAAINHFTALGNYWKKKLEKRKEAAHGNG